MRDKFPVTSGWLRNNECGRRRTEKRSERLVLAAFEVAAWSVSGEIRP